MELLQLSQNENKITLAVHQLQVPRLQTLRLLLYTLD